MSLRSNKLSQLSEFCSLETGKMADDWAVEEDLLYEKALSYKPLCKMIRKCQRCPGLNITRITEACPGWGNLNARVMFIGQSLHDLGVVTDLPFIKGSGYMIDAALHLSGLRRWNCFFTNVLHCHPEGNRPSTPKERKNCLPFLIKEVDIVQPKMIVALGNDAKESLKHLRVDKKMKIKCMVHPASLIYSAPEKRPDWIVKLSLEIDKCLE